MLVSSISSLCTLPLAAFLGRKASGDVAKLYRTRGRGRTVDSRHSCYRHSSFHHFLFRVSQTVPRYTQYLTPQTRSKTKAEDGLLYVEVISRPTCVALPSAIRHALCARPMVEFRKRANTWHTDSCGIGPVTSGTVESGTKRYEKGTHMNK